MSCVTLNFILKVIAQPLNFMIKIGDIVHDALMGKHGIRQRELYKKGTFRLMVCPLLFFHFQSIACAILNFKNYYFLYYLKIDVIEIYCGC